METLEQVKDRFNNILQKADEVEKYLYISEKKDDLKKLRKLTLVPDFWNDQKRAKTVNKKISDIEFEIKRWQDINELKDDIKLNFMMLEEGESKIENIIPMVEKFEEVIDDLETEKLLSGKYDKKDAILIIHPGAGGTESHDWAEMLYRMYTRWFEKKGYKYNVLNFQPGDEAGIKEVVIEVSGQYVYGYLSSEIGVHRLVRISPFDSNARRHTSFASVFVYPEIDDDIEINIEQSDLRIDTYRASGAGGQHVNKTDSAVRITHNPSGIVVSCQNQRSQHQNKEMAMKVLKSRLYQLKVDEEREKQAKLESEKKEIAWGSQIRSYVFQPYTMVKDKRTNFEDGNVQAVMDGKIDGFVKAFLRYKQKNK
ncbi:MAG: peptide chain release factor 2 [Candidatus Marinimicrobia bacterium]|nr:peptide chain release factor 2 [Candidatus Neomarinimicrobiota bacterium]